jgi:hypothetical protein
LQRLAALKLHLPMPEFESSSPSSTAAAAAVPGSAQRKRDTTTSVKASTAPKRVRNVQAGAVVKVPTTNDAISNGSNTNNAPPHPLAPLSDSLLQALTAIQHNNNTHGDTTTTTERMLQSLTAYYRDKRFCELQAHYWICLERVQAECHTHNIDWNQWKTDAVAHSNSTIYPDCVVEARRQLQETQQRLEDARAAATMAHSGSMGHEASSSALPSREASV